MAKKSHSGGWSVAGIVNLSVKKAEEIVPLMEDIELLRRAVTVVAHQLEDKRSLWSVLSRQIQLLDRPEFKPKASRLTSKKKRKKNCIKSDA